MNLLLVVEGERSAKRLYKHWIGYLCPVLTYVFHISELTKDNYAMVVGYGFPRYHERIKATFLDVATHSNVDHLFICVDSEDKSYSVKYDEMWSFIRQECVSVACDIHVIIQNHCMETWLMGNKKINITHAGDPELIKYRRYHNVNILDPEGLTPIDHRSIGKFTHRYLKLMLKTKNINYSKRDPGKVKQRSYFNELVKRYRNDRHIDSFGYLFDRMTQICTT